MARNSKPGLNGRSQPGVAAVRRDRGRNLDTGRLRAESGKRPWLEAEAPADVLKNRAKIRADAERG